MHMGEGGTSGKQPTKTYSILLEGPESTVCAEAPAVPAESTAYQSEAELESALIKQLTEQGYERLVIHSEAEMIANLRAQIESLNGFAFTDDDWNDFYRTQIAHAADGIVEKTRRIQRAPVIDYTCTDGTLRNIMLLDRDHIHRNRLQVLNQYEANEGGRRNRYDVTILVNGLPLVHIELKRRGVNLRQAFNQIERYQRESFWSGSGLFQYVQIFIISNGTLTKYYSNTTRWQRTHDERGKKTNASYQFTSWWTDVHNKRIADLGPFAASFLARGTLLMILTHYCVLDVDDNLLVMRPYQICATERILNRILISETDRKRLGTLDAGGYIWHTTGSGKTLTSFKTAVLASRLKGVDKVLFVVDRKDLDYQTMKEYNKFQPGAVNGSTNTAALIRNLRSTDVDKRICVTTIQKLAAYLAKNAPARGRGAVRNATDNAVFDQHTVFIFDECHRSQFGRMHRAITRAFRNYHLFGFTGTPIFAVNARSGGDPELKTTEQAFGDRLHQYTVVDAINDGNVLPFKVDYIKTFHGKDDIGWEPVEGINTDTAWRNPTRIRRVSEYILDHYDQKTKRDAAYLTKDGWRKGFNSILACDSIDSAKAYYTQLRKMAAERHGGQSGTGLKIATIFTYAANGDDQSGDEFDATQGMLTEESMDTEGMSASDRAFLDCAIDDYNAMFHVNFDTDAKGFDGYYKDVSQRMKDRELDLLIVVDMFLTGFDAKTLNTLWVDKNLRLHGLIQAFSRTNRILNSVKTFGNIVCFRDLSAQVDEALALFGDSNASGVVLLKPYKDYYAQYQETLDQLHRDFPLEGDFQRLGERREKAFVKVFGTLLRLRNILGCFDQFAADDTIEARELQDYQSHYLDIADAYRRRNAAERVDIGDDLVFEMELIKQVEVNIDYILGLVEQYHGDHVQDKEIAERIRGAVESSPELRNKADLIDRFLHAVGFEAGSGTDGTFPPLTPVDGHYEPPTPIGEIPDAERHDYVARTWRDLVSESMENELHELIEHERLKPEPTRELVSDAFANGGVPEEGTAINAIMKPVSMFAKGNPYGKQRARVMELLTVFYERFRGLTVSYPMDDGSMNGTGGE